MTRSIPPPYLSGGRTRAHSWWPLFWALVVLFTAGSVLTLIVILGERA